MLSFFGIPVLVILIQIASHLRHSATSIFSAFGERQLAPFGERQLAPYLFVVLGTSEGRLLFVEVRFQEMMGLSMKSYLHAYVQVACAPWPLGVNVP